MNRGPPGMGPDFKPGPNAADRSIRSVFVGNISYEVTEEQLRNVFSQVGPVVHLRMMHDRETGKPKGYGFCEFADTATAEAAIRNLNGYELHGRPLRVDSAAGGSDRQEEPPPPTVPPELENPYGPEPEQGKAPEAISKTVASLPPEKMFELMKQMRDVIRNNPDEGRALLLENPQLAYALLQAQVVMRIVDPQVAIAMLHRENPTGPQPPITAPFHHVAPPYGGPGPMPPMGPPMMPPPMMSGGPGPHGGMPPYGGGRGGPPPREMAPQNDDQGDAELLMQVLKLSDEEIAMLPPGDREKVIELRNQLKNLPT